MVGARRVVPESGEHLATVPGLLEPGHEAGVLVRQLGPIGRPEADCTTRVEERVGIEKGKGDRLVGLGSLGGIVDGRRRPSRDPVWSRGRARVLVEEELGNVSRRPVTIDGVDTEIGSGHDGARDPVERRGEDAVGGGDGGLLNGDVKSPVGTMPQDAPALEEPGENSLERDQPPVVGREAGPDGDRLGSSWSVL